MFVLLRFNNLHPHVPYATDTHISYGLYRTTHVRCEFVPMFCVVALSGQISLIRLRGAANPGPDLCPFTNCVDPLR